MENKTIAQQLNVKDFPFEIKDENGNVIYYEDSDNYWIRYEFDSNGNQTYYINSCKCWERSKFDSNNNLVHWRDFDGNSFKQEFDSNNNRIYFEASNGQIIDNRPKVKEVIKEVTMDELEKVLISEIANILGIKIKY
jgi:hypothetical protein